MKEITLQCGGTYMKNNIKKYLKNSLVVKFFIWFISSLFALVCVEQIVYIISPYDINIRAYGIMIIGLIIIFGLLILKKLDELKNR